MNGYYSWWNSKIKTPRNHKNIIAIAELDNLDLMNTTDVMTYTNLNGTGESIIDLAFSTPNLTWEIDNWTINEEAHAGSDQKVNTFAIYSTSIEIVPEPTTQRYNWNKMNWPEFRKQLQTNAADTEEEGGESITHNRTKNMERAVEQLTNLIQRVAEKHTPKDRPSARSKP